MQESNKSQFFYIVAILIILGGVVVSKLNYIKNEGLMRTHIAEISISSPQDLEGMNKNIVTEEMLVVGKSYKLMHKENGTNYLCDSQVNQCNSVKLSSEIEEKLKASSTLKQEKARLELTSNQLKEIIKQSSIYGENQSYFNEFFLINLNGYDANMLAHNSQKFTVRLKNVRGMDKPQIPSKVYATLSQKGNIKICSKTRENEMFCYEVEENIPLQQWMKAGSTVEQKQRDIENHEKYFKNIQQMLSQLQDKEEISQKFN